MQCQKITRLNVSWTFLFGNKRDYFWFSAWFYNISNCENLCWQVYFFVLKKFSCGLYDLGDKLNDNVINIGF